MIIYGSGMAGLLAANMLRRWQPFIREGQKSLPNNHGALLRFRSDICSRVTGIPFTKVQVKKAVCIDGYLHDTATLAWNNMYSLKVTGMITDRSVLKTESVERYVAPLDFIQQMSNSTQVIYDSPLTPEIVTARTADSEPVISTIPMPVLMAMVGWPVPKFQHRKIWSITITIPNCRVYQTIYYPHADLPYYRASITGDRLIIESAVEPEDYGRILNDVILDFGLGNIRIPEPEVKEQEYGKITALDTEEGRRFITYMTDKYRIYSLGRFATWRQLLLDDVVHDVQVIEKLIGYRESYSHRLQEAK